MIRLPILRYIQHGQEWFMKAPILRRTPKHYDGIESPAKEIKNLLPKVIKDIEGAYAKKSIHVIKAWPEIIGEKLAPMTQVVSLS